MSDCLNRGWPRLGDQARVSKIFFGGPVHQRADCCCQGAAVRMRKHRRMTMYICQQENYLCEHDAYTMLVQSNVGLYREVHGRAM
jgi:hypothetical protein